MSQGPPQKSRLEDQENEGRRASNEIFSLYLLSFGLGFVYLAMHTRLAQRLSPDLIESGEFFSGVGAILCFQWSFLRLWYLWSSGLSPAWKGPELFEPPPPPVLPKAVVSNVAKLSNSSIKVLFSHPDLAGYPQVWESLKSVLAQDAASPVEVIVKASARETLLWATDNVFDLIVIASEYRQDDLKAQKLCHEIKRLDRNIPVIVLCEKSATPSWHGGDEWLRLSEDDETVHRLAEYVRKKT